MCPARIITSQLKRKVIRQHIGRYEDLTTVKKVSIGIMAIFYPPRSIPSMFNQTNIDTVSRAALRKTAKRRGGARMGLSKCYDAILS